jgi:glycosyltransferase involved in cell wall biosynthesis
VSATASVPSESARPREWIALLGRRDTPVDGVEDYCTFLGRALAARGIELRQVRVPWNEKGCIGALRQLKRECAAWHGTWVIIQYTALGWSRRGFPFLALAVIAILRRSGAQLAVVMHEPYRQSGNSSSWIDGIRGACQDCVIHNLYRSADKAVFPDPLETIDWLPKDLSKAAFVPIGANIPEPDLQSDGDTTRRSMTKKVAVFCVSESPYQQREVGDVAHAARAAASNGSSLHLIFVGRGTAEAQPEIERVFRDIPVQVSNLGLRTAEEVSRILASSDAMICVRGKLFPRRGSALAGIACGLPIIGYAGAAERTPLEEAGVCLVPSEDRDALGAALSRVLRDPELQRELRRRSLRAQAAYFSWDTIAAAFIRELGVGQAES